MAILTSPLPSMGIAAGGRPAELPLGEARKLRMALRDLIWRVDHLRDAVEKSQDPLELQKVLDLLDTSEARAALRYPARF